MPWRWKKCSPLMPSGARTIEHGRPFEVWHHPFADGLEIMREIELGHGLAVAGIGPQRLVGMGDDDAHHFRGGLAVRFGR